MEYQVQMVYEREDVSALVRTLDFSAAGRRKPPPARKIGYRVFGVLLIAVAVFTVGAMVYAGVFSPSPSSPGSLQCAASWEGGPPSPV